MVAGLLLPRLEARKVKVSIYMVLLGLLFVLTFLFAFAIES